MPNLKPHTYKREQNAIKFRKELERRHPEKDFFVAVHIDWRYGVMCFFENSDKAIFVSKLDNWRP